MPLLTSPVLLRSSVPSMALLLITTVFGTVSMHIIVPVLPAMAESLQVSAGSAQLVITLYLVGVSFGQLIYGPLSDRFGRRPILIVGLAIYIVAMAGGALAANLGWLLVARVGQALGGSCALVVGRAMVRDGSENAAAASRLAILSMGLSLSPAVAPLFGAYISAAYGWRMIFTFLATCTAILLIIVLLILPETSRRKTPLPGVGAMLGSYGTLVRKSRFLGYAIGGATGTSFYAFLSASPFIFNSVLHRTPQEAGIIYLPTLAGFTLGSFMAMRLAKRFGGRQLAVSGNFLAMIGPALMLLAYATDSFNLWTLLIPMTLFTLGTGVMSPFAQAGAVGADLQRIGAASGLYGFLQMSVGALCTLIVSLFAGAPVLPMILIMLTLSIVGQIAFRLVGPDVD